MISVVVPLYNKESFIANTIQSVLHQSLPDFELIVVNDQSTDNSTDVVRNFQDDRIRLINIEKSGVSAARNKGIEVSKFEWIAFLDADDWWAPTFLEELICAIQEYPNHNIFASGRSKVFLNTTERYNHELLPLEGATEAINYIKVISKYLPLVNSSNIIIKKSLLESVGGFKTSQKKHEDHDLWLRLSNRNAVIFINKPLSFYRKTEDDTGSSQLYEANDFLIYLRTLQDVKAALLDSEKKDFRLFCNRFVLLTYIKYYGAYSKDEEQAVFNLANLLLTGMHLKLLKLLKVFPYKNTYPFFKLLQQK